MPNDISIVIYLTAEWETFHRRPMIEAMARNLLSVGRILCVNPVINPITALLRGDRRSAIQTVTDGGIQKISENLYVVHQHAPFYSTLVRFFELSNHIRNILSTQIKKALEVIGASSADKQIAWLYRPEQLGNIGLIDETHVLYECYDEYCYTIVDYKPKLSVIEQEKLLLQQADIVFTTSKALYESRRRLHSNVHLVPNGVDFEHFASTLNARKSPPQDILDIRKPIIGYVGNFRSWLDFDVLLDIVDNPEWSFVLIGDILYDDPKGDLKSTLNCLKKRSNFYHLGWKKRSQLPAYLDAMDVAVIPFIVNDFFKSVHPLKLWEYLAAGRPVISTNISSEVWELREVVLVAHNRDEFLRFIDYALKKDVRERIAKGVEIARQNSWDRITKDAVDIIQRAVNSTGRGLNRLRITDDKGNAISD